MFVERKRPIASDVSAYLHPTELLIHRRKRVIIRVLWFFTPPWRRWPCVRVGMRPYHPSERRATVDARRSCYRRTAVSGPSDARSFRRHYAIASFGHLNLPVFYFLFRKHLYDLSPERRFWIYLLPSLPLPNEDFGRLNQPFRMRFRSTFQGREYSFWAKNR